jgi:hypothetical protein
MIEVESVDASSTIKLLESIEALYPILALIHVFLDNARYHHPPDHSPGVVRERLAQAGRRIRLLKSLSNDHAGLLSAHEPVV